MKLEDVKLGLTVLYRGVEFLQVVGILEEETEAGRRVILHGVRDGHDCSHLKIKLMAGGVVPGSNKHWFAKLSEIEPFTLEDTKSQQYTEPSNSTYHMAPILDGNGKMDHYHMVRTIEAHTGKSMDPAKQHALKKIAFGGHRGHKDELKDVQEAIKTLTEYAAWLERKPEE